jgi:cell division protein FtsN
MKRYIFISVLFFFFAGCSFPKTGFLPESGSKEMKQPQKTVVQPEPAVSAVMTEEQQKKQAVEAMEKKLAELEESNAKLLEENKKARENLDALVKKQEEIKEKQKTLEIEQEKLRKEEGLRRNLLETAPQKPKIVKKTAVTRPLTKLIAGKHPYAVHVSSFKDVREAREKMLMWQKEGYLASITVYNDIKRGKWYRVVIDRFTSEKDASGLIEKLKKTKQISYARALFLPYSIEVSKFESYEDALKTEEDLFKGGYLPYIVPEPASSGKVSYQVLIGAYKTSREAALVSKKLEEDGYKNKIILP